jgi:hypothetical protein
MGRALVVVRSDGDRAKAARWASKAPDGCRIEFKASRRTLPQNARMWSMLGEIAEQVLWHGQRLRPDDFKLIFLDALKRELRVVPNLDGNGFVNLGRSSSDLSKAEMGDLMELISAWGAEHGVVFSGEKVDAA